jgi:hypothetical protein
VARPGWKTRPVRLTDEDCWARLRTAEHGVLCTTAASGDIDVVPTCLAVVGQRIATPIDTVKAKDTTELGRRKNLDRDAAATLLCEHWDSDDWSRLWWVRARLVLLPDHDSAEGEAALRAKYPQYGTIAFAAVLIFDVSSTLGWAAVEPGP